MKRTLDRGFNVHAYWERRAERPEALAARFVRTIDSLQNIDRVFALWTCVSKHPQKFETVRDRYVEEVVAGVIKDDWGKPEPIYGYRFGAFTRGQPGNRIFDVSVRAGSTYPRPFPNDVWFFTGFNFVPDPAITTYKIFKSALLAVVEAWDPVRCAAYPDMLRNLGKKGCYFRESWIQYLCPWLASLVTPPASCLAEHLPNGGLLMSATTETFDVENPVHMAAARAIGAAIAPLNDLPWEDRARA